MIHLHVSTSLQIYTVKFTGYILYNSLKWTSFVLFGITYVCGNNLYRGSAQLGLFPEIMTSVCKPRPRLAYALCTYGS